MSLPPNHTHQRDNSIGITTSAAVRTPSPVHSPIVSPSSPTADGLSRRQSWNRTPRPIEDTLSPLDAQHVLTYLPTPPSPHSAPAFAGPPPAFVSSHGPDTAMEEYDLGLPASAGPAHHAPRPFAHHFPSETSLASIEDLNSSVDDLGDGVDQERLTSLPVPTLGGGHRRQPSKRVYDEQGLARTSTPVRFANSIGRSETFRKVSRTLRKASVRVVNLGGHDRLDENDDGQWQDEEGDLKKGEEEYEMRREEVGVSIPPPRPGPMPPEPGLRGRTLCMFSSRSTVRRAMHALLRWTWTEPIILGLIIANVVVLAIQGGKTLNVPRIDTGYFTSWEDYVLLALFILFTLEMFARIVTTGLLLDPNDSLRDFFLGPTGVVPTVEKRVGIAQASLKRSMSKTKGSEDIPVAKPHWSAKRASVSPQRQGTLPIAELPFQRAVAKQQSLSTYGRPYLRHSWHRIDMIAVIAFWITFLLAITRQETTASRHIYIFRALSVLRAGRLLVVTSGTSTILHSLKRAGPMLITVAYFVVFAAVVFSIIGVQSFRGSLRRQCVLTNPFNESSVIDLGNQCGGYLDPANLTTVTFEDMFNRSANSLGPKGYICPLNSVCAATDENPEDNTQSFDNIFASLVQIIVISSINTWAPTMYMTMDAEYFGSSLFFLAAVIVLNFWLINLVVAVVVNTFKDIRAATKKSAFGADDGLLGSDLQWTTEKKAKGGRILRAYEKTQLFWVASIVADLVAQAYRGADSPASTLKLLKNVEIAFTIAFDVEIVWRFVGHLPEWKAFFTGPRNSFDLFLAVSCSIIQIPVILNAPAYPWLTVFQLLRWYRVILAFPRMKPLLVTVFGSFAGMLNLIVFLFLMNFIGALLAIQLLRGDLGTDNTINFSQTYNAFLGMYQIFSSENWTTLLYNAMSAEDNWKQSWIAAIFLCAWFLFAYFIVLQMFIAVINENFAIAEEQKRKQQMEAFIRKTEPVSAHVSWIDRLNPYRLMKAHHNSIKVDTLPANLVLPLKQSVGTDVGVSSKPQDGLEENGTKSAMHRLFGFERDEKLPVKRLRPLSGRIDDFDDLQEDERGLSDLLPPLTAGPSTDEHMDAIRERRNKQADFIAAHPTFDQSLWLFKQSNPVRRWCQACVSPAYGERIFGRPANPRLRLVSRTIVFLAVIASITVAAIATPLYRKQFYEEHGIYRGTWFDLSEVSLGAIFVLEAAVKIIADGFVFAPNAYLLSLWNVLDFIVLITLLVNTTTSLIFIGGLSRLTRALKGFRALRLITLFGRLRDTLHAVLFAGAMKILDASILMILYIIPFAVWGVNIFAGQLYSCNDGDASGLSDCINEYMAAPLDDSLSFLVPRVWDNPKGIGQTQWTFDNFRSSILILFEIVSLEGWIDVMQSAMSVTAKGLQPIQNAAQWNSVFFIIFNLLGAAVILALFVSIIIGNFSLRSGSALLTAEQNHWQDLAKFIKAQTPSQLPKLRPQTALREWCYERATQKHGWWMRGFTGLYYVHILLLMMEDYSNNILTDISLDWIFLLFSLIYAIDILVRLYGLGFQSFRKNGWNLFDVFVVTGSFTTTIPALRAAQQGVPGSQGNIQLQKLFLVSIALKLVQRISSLNQLFKTSVASLPAIGNLFLLWATLFIFFSILYMEVFGLTKQGDNAGSRFQNYYSFGNSIIMLAFMSTGEGWNGYMHDYTLSYPRCTDNDSFLQSDCGSASWAFGLFISWNILSMYIFVNMFTGVVVESFAYVYQMPGGASLNREEMRSFKKLWAEFDTERNGYLKRKDFIPFFSKLTGVFEVHPYPPEYSVHNIMRASVPDPVANASGKLLVATGSRRAVDVRRVESIIRQIDFKKVRERRRTFERLYHEARISAEPGRGISFTNMLMMLAHYKLIDDEKALLLDDLLIRRVKTERVTDLVNLDRVRGLLRTIWARRRFLASRDERRRTLNAEAEGIPAIVLEPTPNTPPDFSADPFEGAPQELPHSPTESRAPSPLSSPVERSGPGLYSPDISFRDGLGHSPARSLGGNRPSLARTVSDASHLSSDDAHYRHGPDSPIEEAPSEGFTESMETSVWGDMMREAVDKEEA